MTFADTASSNSLVDKGYQFDIGTYAIFWQGIATPNDQCQIFVATGLVAYPLDLQLAKAYCQLIL